MLLEQLEIEMHKALPMTLRNELRAMFVSRVNQRVADLIEASGSPYLVTEGKVDAIQMEVARQVYT